MESREFLKLAQRLKERRDETSNTFYELLAGDNSAPDDLKKDVSTFINAAPGFYERFRAETDSGNSAIPFSKYVEYLTGFPKQTMSGIPNAFFKVLGEGEGLTSVKRFSNNLQTSENIEALHPNAILNLIVSEYFEGNYRELLSSESSIDRNSNGVQAPNLERANVDFEENRDDATPPEVAISLQEKLVTPIKYSTGLTITRDALEKTPIPLLSQTLTDIGIQLDNFIFGRVVNVIQNGDTTSNSSAETVGVASTTSLSYDDLVRVRAAGNRIRRNFDTLLMRLDTYLDFIKLTEFRNNDARFPEENAILSGTLGQRPSRVVISERVAANNILFVDTGSCVAKYDLLLPRVSDEFHVRESKYYYRIDLEMVLIKLRRDAAYILTGETAYTSLPTSLVPPVI